MNDIEFALTAYLETIGTDKAKPVDEKLIEEFGERCKNALRKYLTEPEKDFRLRMSNVGRSLRQLMLEKTYGRKPLTPVMKVRMIYGYMAESLMVFLLKASGAGVEELDKEVSYTYNGHKLDGTFDIKVNGKIYDIKSASPYSYTNKFRDIGNLMKDDSFGYLAQGFGYAAADGTPFGGWIAMNKSTGDFKVLSVPGIIYKETQDKYMSQIHYTMNYIHSDNPEIPPCTGVTTNKRTGKPSYTTECFFCDYKDICCKKEEK